MGGSKINEHIKKPCVSIIVPTKNSAAFLDACLRSINNQSYSHTEVIVVDNHSTDKTTKIAKQYANKVYTKGPERSAQRNYGVKKSKGDFVLIIDSDMELTSKVVEECVNKMANTDTKAIIIPEESFGIGFWAQCKKLERSFYIGNDAIEAARFFSKDTYQKLGGFDENLISGEDWELTRRIRQSGHVTRIKNIIRHNEGRLSLIHTLKKKYYYAGQAKKYLNKVGTNSKLLDGSGPLYRYKLFFMQPRKLFKNPVVGVSMLFMKTLEFGLGGIGYLVSRR